MSVDRRAIEHRLVALIAEQTRFRKPIGTATTVNHDIGVDGQDAIDLLLAVQDEFKLADVDDFEFDRFFGPEAGFNPIVWLAEKLGGRSRPLEPLPVSAIAEYIAKKLAPAE
jgi:acyl carrier protein